MEFHTNEYRTDLSFTSSTMSKKAQTVTKVAVPPPPRPRRRVNPPLEGTNIVHMAHEVCAITNPFCPESKNSKWPDASSAQTLTIPVRQRVNLTTDAEGEVTRVFTSAYPTGMATGTTASGVFTMTALSSYSPIFSEADNYRLVSGGVKVTPITSAMNSQGIINIIELPSSDLIQSDYLSINTTLKNFATYESLPLKSEKSIYSVFRPSGPLAREFAPLQTSTFAGADVGTYDWSSICVNVTGGSPSETVAIVDIYLNYEVTVGVASELGFLTSKAPGSSSLLTRASTALVLSSGTFKGSDSSVDESFLSRAFSFLKSSGSFLYNNRKGIARIGIAGAQAYSGDYGGAAVNVGSLAIQNHAAMDVD